MASGSNAEEFILRLNEQISPGARVATNALNQLETQISEQESALSSYESQLEAAAKKLQLISQGNDRGVVNVNQYRKAQSALQGLQEKSDAARAAIDRLGEARGLAGEVSKLQGAEASIKGVADAMAELVAQRRLLESSGGEAADLDRISESLQRHQQSLAEAQQAYLKLGGSAKDAVSAAAGMDKLAIPKPVLPTEPLDDMVPASKGAIAGVEELAGQLNQLGGPAGSAGGMLGRLTGKLKALSALGPAAIATAAAAAFVALAAAIMSAAVAATSYAISAADMARSQRLVAEGIETSWQRLKGLSDIVPRVQARTGLAANELNSLALSFNRTRMPAKNLENALTQMATAKAGGASELFLSRLRNSLIQTGKVPPHLANQMSQFERIAAAKLLALDKQGETLRRNFGRLFVGLKIEPFLKKLSTLVSLFDENTESGKALKAMFGAMFQALIDGATRAIPTIERAFLTLELYALRAATAVILFFKTPEGKTLQKFIMGVGDALLFTGQMALFVAPLITIPFKWAAQQAHDLLTILSTIPAIWSAVGSAAQGAWAHVMAAGRAVISWLTTVDLSKIGTNMMAGLARGIIKGGAAVLGAIKGVVSGASAAASNLLQEHSPSKLFYKKGVNTVHGYAGGVEDEAKVAHKAVADMVTPATGTPAASRAGSTGGERGATIGPFTFENCTFGAGLTEEGLEEMMTPVFHRFALAGMGS